ncbi:MAG: DUF2085 domain-containing protein [Balneolia bacterium]|nr:DUF2085 domain-containing protein [Balneolia bacterium]
MRPKQDSIYYLLALLSGLVVLLSSGFVFIDAPFLHDITHQAFSDLCHQFSFRSFSGDGTSMAVCTRCFGIYTGFFVMAAVGLFFRKHVTIKLRTSLIILLATILVNIIDVGANLVGIWINTDLSRFFTGYIAGLSLILIIFTAGNHHTN